MNLVDLPPYFLLSFITDEILLIEFINVNSAYCNKDTRNKLLFLISIRATPIYREKGVICEQLCIHCGLQNKSHMVNVFFVGNLQNENYDFVYDSLFTNYSSGTTTCATKFSRIRDLRSKPKMVSLGSGSTSQLHHPANKFIVEKILNWPTTHDHIALGNDNSQSFGILTKFNPNGCWELLEGEWWRNRKPGKGKGFIKFFATTIVATQFKVYKGELNGLTMSGHGVMTYVNGQIYTGNWQFDQRCGYGECTYPNRFDSGVGRYFGLWSNDMREGQGVMAFSNGDVYDGEWCEDRMNGKGQHYLLIDHYFCSLYSTSQASVSFAMVEFTMVILSTTNTAEKEHLCHLLCQMSPNTHTLVLGFTARKKQTTN
jgi:hypothetical protein